MKKLKVLIVDDSVIFRSQIRAALETIPEIQVVGTASNGKIALERVSQTSPDVITLDLEMPEMTGLEFLHELKKRQLKASVLVFSSASRRGAESALDALENGAVDFITKPTAENANDMRSPDEKIRSLLLPKLQGLFGNEAKPFSNVVRISESLQAKHSFPKVIWDLFKPKVLVIGSSTGGPNALEEVFSKIQHSLGCPILVAQHMPPVFTEALANRIAKVSGIPAAEAKHGEFLQANRIYVAPGDFHMTLVQKEQGVQVALDQTPQVHSVRPAVDHLFKTAAKIYGTKCLGVVLTGMGEDGKAGAQAIKEHGGAVVIQSKESCVVFGMPGAVFEAGTYDRIANLIEISNLIKEVAAA